MKTGEKWLNL